MRFAPLALALVCLLTLFAGLDTVGYLEAREARDGRVAEELRTWDEVLTPTIGREPLFEKPVLGYALEVLTHDGVHESPLASRLARAALATLLVLLTWRIGALHFGARGGWCAALALATT